MKSLLVKVIVKVIILAIILTMAGTLLNTPILTNEVAMGQMESDNVSYMIWEQYAALRPVVSSISAVAGGLCFLWVGADIVKYTKEKIKENEE